ncbi:ribonuclease H-like domain-containing protein [Tanacetum coccineum]
MDLETAQTTTTAKLSILKLENGNSFKPAAQTTTNAYGTSTSLIPSLVTTEEKYKDAKTLFAAIQTRFCGNEAIKKTQKTLLKQMYKNFSAPSIESLDSIFNRLPKIISQLAILGENISQEDLNLKFLRSLPSEWNTHVVVWRNKPDLDTISFDDLYNNSRLLNKRLKELQPQAQAQVLRIWLLCHPLAVLMKLKLLMELVLLTLKLALLALKLALLDLEQIHEDDLEEIDLKWQLALLSMRTRRFFQKTGQKITINESDTAGYDKSKVECFNCHKMGHFLRECRGPRNQDSRNRNQDSSRRTVNVDKTSSKAMVAIDGAGFDWSYMADVEVPTNMALIAFSDSKVHNDKTCSKTCLKSFKTLKTQLDDLRIEFNKSKFNLATYKRGLASVEEQLVFYKKNEVIFCEQLAILKRDISYKDSEISMLKRSQITDKSRNGVGFVSYNAVLPPHTGLFSPPNLDLSYSGPEEFQQPKFEGYGPKTSKTISEDISNEVKEFPDAPLIEKLVSDDKLEKKTIFPTVAKIEFVRPKQQEKPVRKPVKYAKMYSLFCLWRFDHVQADCNYHHRERVVSGNNYTRVDYNYSAKKAHPNAHRNMVPKAVLMKIGLRPLNTVRPVNTAHPKTTVYSARPMSRFFKSAQSTVKRPYQIRTTLTNKNFSQKVNTAKGKFYNARPKAVNTARPNSAVVDVVKANQGHTHEEDQGYVDNGCSRHMTENISYLSDFKKFDRGYVTFGGGAKGGKITEVDMSNITTTYLVPSTPNTRIHKDHSLDHVIGDVQSGVQTRRMTKTTHEQGFISGVYEGKTHEDLYTCLFACFLSQKEPKRIVKALSDSAWVEAMQEELLQFKLQKVWVLVDFPKEGHTQEEGIDYDEVFAPVARIEAIRLFLAYASFMGFMVYQMDVKSAFLYGGIEEEVYVCQPPGFEDPDYPDKVYKVVKSLYGLHQAPRAWYETLAKYLLDNGFHRGKIDQTLFIKKQKGDILLVQMSSMGELTFFLGLQVKQKEDGIFISQDKYVADILRKFSFTDVRTTSTPMDTEKPLLKDSDGDDVDVHLYRYALTENPTIYVSYIKQFWQTATARTLDNGEIELTATIDGTVKTVTEASVRRHLQLADADGISSLPTTEIFKQLSLMGFIQVFLNKHKRLLQPHIRLYIAPVHTQKLFSNMKRASKGYTGEDILLFPAMIVHGLVVQGEGSTHPVESHHTPTSASLTSQPPVSPTSRRTTKHESVVSQPRSPTQTLVADEIVHEERGDSVEMVATTATSLKA